MKFMKKWAGYLWIISILLFFAGCGQAEAQQPASVSTTAQSSSLLKVHTIDVGQGDSIFIELPNTQAMLIDAGTNASDDIVCAYIKGLGYEKIDYLIGTHPHEDHIGGLDTVIKTFDIGNIYMPKASANTKTFEDVLTAIKDKGLSITTAKAGVSILNSEDPALSINIVAPNQAEYADLNNYSAVIKLTYGDTSFLFTGDAETLSEKEITGDISADVLKAGHHGSDTSSSPEFVSRVAPKYVLISVGTGNKYGHPVQSVLDTFDSIGAEVFRTDLLGSIVTVSDGKTISFNQKGAVPSGNAIQSTPASPSIEQNTVQQPATTPSESTPETVEPPASEPAQPNAPAQNIASENGTAVYVTKSGKKYHTDSCSSLSKSKIEKTLSAVQQEGYEPCSKCNPPQ